MEYTLISGILSHMPIIQSSAERLITSSIESAELIKLENFMVNNFLTKLKINEDER